MMSKNIKILLSFLFMAVVIFVTTLSVVTTKIKPDEIKKYISESVEQNFVNVKASIKKITYKVGSSINIEIKNFLLTSNTDRSKLLEIDNIIIKAPLTSVLTSGSVIEVLAHNPKIYIRSLGLSTNWRKAIRSKNISGANLKKVEIPRFIKESRVNYRFLNNELLVDLAGTPKKNYHVDKLVLKNVSLTKSTAFEIKSNLETPKHLKISSSVQVIGELYLRDFIEKTILNCSTSIKIESQKSENPTDKLPVLKGKLKFEGGVAEFKALTNIELKNHFKLQSKINKSEDELEFTDLNINLNNNRMIDLMSAKLIQQIPNVEWNNSETQMSGTAKLDLESLRLSPKLTYEMNSNINIKPYNLVLSIDGKINPESILVNGKGDYLGGSLKISLEAFWDSIIIGDEIKTSSPVLLSFSGEQQQLSSTKIRSYLWAKKLENKDMNQKTSVIKTSPVPIQAKISLDFKRLTINNRELSLSSNLNYKESLISGPVVLRNNKGKIDIKIKSSAEYKSFTGKIKEFEMASFENVFIRNSHLNVSGLYDGKFSYAKKNGVLKYSMNLSANDGELYLYNLSNQLNTNFKNLNKDTAFTKFTFFEKKKSKTVISLSGSEQEFTLHRLKSGLKGFSLQGRASRNSDDQWLFDGSLSLNSFKKLYRQKRAKKPLMFKVDDQNLLIDQISFKQNFQLKSPKEEEIE